MPTRPEETHDSPTQPQAATAELRRSSQDVSRAEAKAEPHPADKAALPNTNEDDATSGDQDIDTAGTAHDDASPTKSM